MQGTGHENYAYGILLLDRDLNGFEQAGIKGYITKPWLSVRTGLEGRGEITYNAGVSPGGNYLFWREGTDNCTNQNCVKILPTASVNGDTPYNNAIYLNNESVGYHFATAYDDLGNEVYVTDRAWNIYYWKFNAAPGNSTLIAHWSKWKYTQYGGDGYVAFHEVNAGVIPGPRSWIAIVNTDGGTNDECGYEGTTLGRGGASTITFVHVSAAQPKIFRLVHERHEANGYSEECFGSISRDGTKFYWQSDWCNAYNQQIFRAELPAKWWEDVLGMTSDTTPPQVPTGVTVT